MEIGEQALEAQRSVCAGRCSGLSRSFAGNRKIGIDDPTVSAPPISTLGNSVKMVGYLLDNVSESICNTIEIVIYGNRSSTTLSPILVSFLRLVRLYQ